MRGVTIEEAQADLGVLISELKPGEEIEITRDNQIVAKLVGPKRRQFGLGKGDLIIKEEDDEHLEGFEEYLP